MSLPMPGSSVSSRPSSAKRSSGVVSASTVRAAFL